MGAHFLAIRRNAMLVLVALAALASSSAASPAPFWITEGNQPGVVYGR